MAKTPEDESSFAGNNALCCHRSEAVVDRLIYVENDLNVIYGGAVRSVNCPGDVKYVVVHAGSRVLCPDEEAAK